MSKFLKKITYFFFFFFLLENNVYSMLKNEQEGHENPSCFRFFVPCFKFCWRESVDLYDEDRKFLLEEKSFSRRKNRNIIRGFKQLPLELYGVIAHEINALDSVHLSMVSKALRKQSIEFWEMYIKNTALEKWDSSISAIKVAYANQLFAKGKLEKAAKLGFPKAVAILRYREKQKVDVYSGEFNNFYRPMIYNVYFNKGFH